MGTANIDESTQSITDKVYDRAQILNFEDVCSDKADGSNPGALGIGCGELSDLFRKAWGNPACQLDNEQIMLLDETTAILKKLDLAYGARVKAQLEKYVPVFAASYRDPKQGKTVALDLFIANKLLCKLNKRFSYSAAEKENLEELEYQFEHAFGKESRSYSMIRSFIEKYADD